MKTISSAHSSHSSLARRPAFAADGIAFITNLKGEVAVDGNPRPVLLSELAKGQKITVGQGLAGLGDVHRERQGVRPQGPGRLPGEGHRDRRLQRHAAGRRAAPSGAPATRCSRRSRRPPRRACACARSRRPRPTPRQARSIPTEGSVATLQPDVPLARRRSEAAGRIHAARRRARTSRCTSAKAAGRHATACPAKLQPETEYAWTVTRRAATRSAPASSARSRPRRSPQVEKRRPSEQGRVLRPPAVHADAAGDGRDAGSARVVGAPRRRSAPTCPSSSALARRCAPRSPRLLLAAALARRRPRGAGRLRRRHPRQRHHRGRRQARPSSPSSPPGTRLLLGTGATRRDHLRGHAAPSSRIAGPGEFLVGARRGEGREGRGAEAPQRVGAARSGVVARVVADGDRQPAHARPRCAGAARRAARVSGRHARRDAAARAALARRCAGEEYTVALQDADGKELWKGSGTAAGHAPGGRSSPPATRYTWTVMTPRGRARRGAASRRFRRRPSRRAEKSRAAARSFPERVVHALLLQELGADAGGARGLGGPRPRAARPARAAPPSPADAARRRAFER